MERAGKKERTRISQDIITSNTQYEVMGETLIEMEGAY